jgi:hypothetical protein
VLDSPFYFSSKVDNVIMEAYADLKGAKTLTKMFVEFIEDQYKLN